MASRVAIFNAALGGIGQGTTIADPAGEQSPEAKACRRHYVRCRDGLLSEHPWLFARRCETLAAWPSPPPDAAYAYVRDPSYLVIRRVDAWLGGPPVPWRVGGVTDPEQGDVTLLLTEQPVTIVTATRRIENEALFPVLFEEALGWRLAWAIAKELSKDAATRQECWVQHLYWGNLAKAEDQKQATLRIPDGELYEARDGLTFGLSAADGLTASRSFPVA